MNDINAPLYLGPSELDALEIGTEESVHSIEHLIRERAEGRMWNAPKSALYLPDNRFLMSTLAAADNPPFIATKSLVLNPRNPESGEPLINSAVVLLDSKTGQSLALIDGNWITAIRTAALSAVAAKRLARSDSGVVAFIGCGVQAQSHLRALVDLFPLREIRMLGRGRPNLDALSRTGEEMGLSIIECKSAREAMEGADLVVSSVSFSPGDEPFIDARWMAPGAFAAITDLALPWVPQGMSTFDNIIIDDLEQEAIMPQPLVPSELVMGDITGLVNGAVEGRQSRSERTAFVFRGLALGDLALAGLAYQRSQ
ncbi:MAG: ornithine cyclodeaminase family protein [Halieaceae bacterium]|jgi:ornithine cyclodeaminase/alanine dehydrogenase-like protein (mu-crystallin family)|nr:ornithine cyclodeaminase family protein [Halieaceae bacterium]